jgi:hypothetical protein
VEGTFREEIKRFDLLTHYHNVKAYGAKGDGVTDDTKAIQAAIDAAEAADKAALYFPPGLYKISSSLNITVNEIQTIRGEGYKSIIKATASLAAIFDFTSGGTDTTANNYLTIKDLYLEGDHKANYCVYAERFTRTDFYNVMANGAVIANIGLRDNQWINNFWGCKMSNSQGDGIILDGTATNIVNLIGCAIESNVGIGIKAVKGKVINVIGCTIEGSGEAGIWTSSAQNFNIHNNYFEANNAQGGVSVTVPTTFTIKADVIISGSQYPDISNNLRSQNLSIRNNWHGPGALGECMYYASAIESGEISDNYCEAVAAKVCLGIYGNRDYSRIGNLRMTNNRGTSDMFVGEQVDIMDAEPAAGSFDQLIDAHTWQISDVPHINIMPQDFTTYTKVVDDSKSSTLTRNAAAYYGMDAFTITKAGDSSDVWGATLDIDNDYPEFSGKLCYFGAWVKWDAGTGNNALLYTTTTGNSVSSYVTAYTDWTFVSMLFTMPASGATSWECGFAKIGAGSSDVLHVAFPVLARVGDGYLTHVPERDTVGSGSAPSYLRLYSPNGTLNYLFIEDDGTVKRHTAVPTANADGSAVGDQTD